MEYDFSNYEEWEDALSDHLNEACRDNQMNELVEAVADHYDLSFDKVMEYADDTLSTWAEVDAEARHERRQLRGGW
jgi:hypothetical protein